MASQQRCTTACEQLPCVRSSLHPHIHRTSTELFFVDDDIEDCDLSCPLYDGPACSPLDDCETPESAKRSLSHRLPSPLESPTLKTSASLPAFLTPSAFDPRNVAKERVSMSRKFDCSSYFYRHTPVNAANGVMWSKEKMKQIGPRSGHETKRRIRRTRMRPDYLEREKSGERKAVTFSAPAVGGGRPQRRNQARWPATLWLHRTEMGEHHRSPKKEASAHRSLPCDAETDTQSKRHHSSEAKSPREARTAVADGQSSAQQGNTTVQLSAGSVQDDPGSVQSSGTLLYPHSCRTCYGDCVKKLMTLCESQDVKKFDDTLRPLFKGSKLNKIEETVDSETYIVDTGNKAAGSSDIVVQLFVIDTHSASRVYSTVFSCRKLSDLHTGLNNKCFGFRLIRRIELVQDMLPENFSKAYDEFARFHPRCYQPHPDLRPKDQRYLVVEADYSGPSILQSKLKPAQAINIIGQVACSLAVAERELQFEHRNLHEENIRVLPSTSKSHHFLIDGRTCCVKGAGIKVTLFDDNFGRMTYNNETIIRMRNYNCVYKEKTAIYLTMERIIKERWEVFHSETNALWLAYLCGHLSDYLTVPNPTGDWQRKLELLALMQRDLHRFRSAEEFVWGYINKIGHVHSEYGYQPRTWNSRSSAGPPIYTGLLSFLRWKDRKRKDGDSGGHSSGSTSGRGGGGAAASSATAVMDHRREP